MVKTFRIFPSTFEAFRKHGSFLLTPLCMHAAMRPHCASMLLWDLFLFFFLPTSPSPAVMVTSFSFSFPLLSYIQYLDSPYFHMLTNAYALPRLHATLSTTGISTHSLLFSSYIGIGAVLLSKATFLFYDLVPSSILQDPCTNSYLLNKTNETAKTKNDLHFIKVPSIAFFSSPHWKCTCLTKKLLIF